MPTAFNGQLKSNEIFASLFNMIISQQVFADNIAGTSSELADLFKVDGTLYGDTKLYYATDALRSEPWMNDAEAANLLNLHRPEAPKCQAITIDTFRQISLTVDDYLSKRAWGNEGVFSQFTSVMLGWIGDTKRIYDSTLMNVYVGTTETTEGKQLLQITLPTIADDKEAENRLQAQTIATELEDLCDELKDISRDYNDYGNIRSYKLSDLVLVINSEYANKITKMDLPTIFHKDGLFNGEMKRIKLNSKYFGTINQANGTADGVAVRSAKEMDYIVNGESKHYFAGELLPQGTEYQAGETYTEDHTIIAKIMFRKSVPYMSAFEARTSFFNPKSLTRNEYLTFGHNTLDYLANYPFITIKGNIE